MSLWNRLTNTLRGDESRLNREIDEELESHIQEAIDRGSTPDGARRAFGSPLRTREKSRDLRLIGWLDSLRSDALFGWRQMLKNRVTSAAAVLSLALAVGSCTSAFRLIDALLLRPLPIANSDELYLVSRYGPGFDGKPGTSDSWAYPSFERIRDAARNEHHTKLFAVSYAERMDLTFASDQEMEKSVIQYVSGGLFGSFGIRPAIGRLFATNDDERPGAHPYAVLSNDYWNRRFGADRNVVGRSVHIGERVYEIIGVVDGPYSGTEPGVGVDIFLPTMMHSAAVRKDSTWLRTFARVTDPSQISPMEAQFTAILRRFEEERLGDFRAKPKNLVNALLNQTIRFEPAAAGTSGLQLTYRTALITLSVLVSLVLFIACVNVANLMTARAASRAREMALRVSIGAGRWRLIQLVLVESGWIALLASSLGMFFAWWSAPLVVSLINPRDNPAHLYLPWDSRVAAFAMALTLLVTVLFGLTPALRASSVQPSSALKGGSDPHSRRRLMNVLIGAQVAFCFIVLFVTGLFTTSFERLQKRPLGFSTDRILVLETLAHDRQSTVVWEQVAAAVRNVSGVESAVLASAPILNGMSWNSFIYVNGQMPDPSLAFFLSTSPGWLETMKQPLLQGRDFTPTDQATPAGPAIVNETFVRMFLASSPNPIGKSFQKGPTDAPFQVVGVVRDAMYRSVKGPVLPTAYVPFQTPATAPRRDGTIVVRSATADPKTLAASLRMAVPAARPDFRVSNIRTQQEIVQMHTVRERLLAMLALFFASVALVLAGIGLFGVLDYGVLQRRREIGIRMAIGAHGTSIAALITSEMFCVVAGGAVIGLAVALAGARYIETLIFGVRSTEGIILLTPSILIICVSMLAALPAVIHAVRIDPVKMLRSE